MSVKLKWLVVAKRKREDKTFANILFWSINFLELIKGFCSKILFFFYVMSSKGDFTFLSSLVDTFV